MERRFNICLSFCLSALVFLYGVGAPVAYAAVKKSKEEALAPLLDPLAKYEEVLFGEADPTLPMTERLDRMEVIIFGEAKTGEIPVRQHQLLSVLSGMSPAGQHAATPANATPFTPQPGGPQATASQYPPQGQPQPSPQQAPPSWTPGGYAAPPNNSFQQVPQGQHPPAMAGQPPQQYPQQQAPQVSRSRDPFDDDFFKDDGFFSSEPGMNLGSGQPQGGGRLRSFLGGLGGTAMALGSLAMMYFGARQAGNLGMGNVMPQGMVGQPFYGNPYAVPGYGYAQPGYINPMGNPMMGNPMMGNPMMMSPYQQGMMMTPGMQPGIPFSGIPGSSLW